MKIYRLLLLLLIASPCFGQAWNGVLASSRAIDWTGAGLPATLPDGETTPNPWTPPTRTQCASLPNTSTIATIQSTMAGCAHGTYVLLQPGTYTIGANTLKIFLANGVSLRGSGPQSTILVFNGSSKLWFGDTNTISSQAITSTLSQGVTSVTIASKGNLVAGIVAGINQCDSGLTGSSCSGTSFDNGGAYLCYNQYVCIVDSTEGTTTSPRSQEQFVYVTSVTGTGPYTVNFTPALRMTNWSASSNPNLSWQTTDVGTGAAAYGIGLEDMTLQMTAAQATHPAIQIQNAYAWWIKGCRILGTDTVSSFSSSSTKNGLVVNNYIDANYPLNGILNLAANEGFDSDTLVINNTLIGGIQWEALGAFTGNVYAFNYMRESQTSYYEGSFDHVPSGIFALYEQNEPILWADDSTHGTHLLNTWFRNNFQSWDPPYVTLWPRCLALEGYARFENVLANTCGNNNPTSLPLSTYINNQTTSTSSGAGNYVYRMGFTNGGWPSDTLTQLSAMLWGNCEINTNTCRFQNSEVPSAVHNYTGTQTLLGTGNGSTTTFTGTLAAGILPCIAGNAVVVSGTQVAVDTAENGVLVGSGTSSISGTVNCTTGAVSVTFGSAPANGVSVFVNTIQDAGTVSSYANSVPANHNLPCSFFMPGFSTSPCVVNYFGATGVNFWNVCTSWSVFPTSCSTTQAQPFPVAGPEVVSGPYTFGHAYDVPSAIAFKNLPIDTSFQVSYTVTSSSWSSGTETLTVSSLPGGTHIMGGFQLSGLPAACIPSSGVSFTGRPDGELQMTGSTATTISYALTGNPGVSCTGNFLFPDIRQFDEQIFSTPTSFPVAQFTPSSINFNNVPVGKNSNPVSVTLQNTGTGTLINTSISLANSKFFIQNNTCGTPATINFGTSTSGFSLTGGSTCTFQVVYSPPAVNADSGSVIFFDNTSIGSDTLTFSGNGQGSSALGVVMLARSILEGKVLLP